MKSIIELKNTVFELKTMIQDLEDSRVPVWDDDFYDYILKTEFAICLIGNVSNNDIVSFFTDKDGNLCKAPFFKVPVEWKMPHVLKALGAFPSISQAMKNNWNFEIPNGFSQHQVRINKVRGVITILKLI